MFLFFKPRISLFSKTPPADLVGGVLLIGRVVGGRSGGQRVVALLYGRVGAREQTMGKIPTYPSSSQPTLPVKLSKGMRPKSRGVSTWVFTFSGSEV